MDCFYGQQPWLLENIDKEGITYIADIPCNTRVWLDLPKTEIPKKKGNRGRNPTRERIADDEPEASRVFLRDTERKELWCQIVGLRVYPVQDELPGKKTFLILRRNEGEKDIKYQFSNASADTSIERAFHDAKGNAFNIIVQG